MTPGNGRARGDAAHVVVETMRTKPENHDCPLRLVPRNAAGATRAEAPALSAREPKIVAPRGRTSSLAQRAQGPRS